MLRYLRCREVGSINNLNSVNWSVREHCNNSCEMSKYNDFVDSKLRYGMPKGNYWNIDYILSLIDCDINTRAESYFHLLKVKAIHGQSIMDKKTMRQAVFEYIEVHCNKTRKRSTSGYLTQKHLN